MAEVVARLPTGSQLALAARSTPRLPAALVGASRRVMAVGVEELKMDQDEARALLEGAGIQLSEAGTAALVALTEGWPVVLYLAALARKARRAGGPQEETGGELSGDDRPLAGYLWAEVLSHQPQPTMWFLTRTVVLDRTCGPLCDAVLDTTGSAEVLASLAGSNLLVIPMDQQQQWYRYHHLLRGLLQPEFRVGPPAACTGGSVV
jgi:LuxR family maltose regulon positive regulatory protein